MGKVVKGKKSNPVPQPVRPPIWRVDIFLIELAGKFGVTGACILSVIFIFLQYGTQKQKEAFIDKFILLKFNSTDNTTVIYLGIFFAVLFMFQNLFFRKKDKINKQRIEELESHNKRLEDNLIAKK